MTTTQSDCNASSGNTTIATTATISSVQKNANVVNPNCVGGATNSNIKIHSNSNSCENNIENTAEIVVGLRSTSMTTTAMNVINNNNTNTNNNNTDKITSNTVESVKRKKLKSRNASLPASNGTASTYDKHHMDAWLETCLKDSSNTQFSSSSEFLEYNPTPRNSFKNYIQQQQQQQQQQHQQPNIGIPQMNSGNIQQQFAMRTNNSTPVGYPNGHGSSTQPSQVFQKQFMKPNGNGYGNNSHMRYTHMFPSANGTAVNNGSNYYGQNDTQDFASLPPIVNLLAGNTDFEQNSTETMENNTNMRGFRFSDPCLLNPSDNDSKISGQNTPDRRMPNDMENNKFFTALMEQINLLHETNSKICRNLHETKVDIEALKHAPSWGLRHRRDSLSGMSTHSQPMVFGGGFGTQSPAPTFHSAAYTPGIMTDVVREVKEAARVREDALLNRVKSMVEERQWSMNEYNLRVMRDIEELKSQIRQMRLERKEANKRINHLESENKYIRQMFTSLINSRNGEINQENLRKPFPTARRSSQPLARQQVTLEEHDEVVAEQIVDTTPSTTSTVDIAAMNAANKQLIKESRHSLSSSDSGEQLPYVNGGVNQSSTVLSPPSFALVSPPPIEAPKRKKDLEKNKKMETESAQQEQLRRELEEVNMARKEADERIIALENLVKTLTLNNTHPVDASTTCIAAIGDGTINRNGVGNKTTDSTAIASQQFNQTQFHKLQQQHQSIVGNNSKYAPMIISQQQQSAQMSPPKLSVAGPITDL